MSLFDLSGKIALVTGGSRGLGREMVLAFAEAGADVVIASRKLEACEGVAREVERLGRSALAVAAHVGRWEDNDMLCERAVSRYTHGSTLAEKQTVTNWVADSLAEMQAARLMTLQAAWKMDTEGAHAARVEIAMIKYFGAKVLYDVIDRAIQVHGSLGFSCDLPLESMYRAARAARLYDGPDEVHRQTVARQVLKGYTPTEVPTEHIPTRRAEAQRRFADLLETLSVDA